MIESPRHDLDQVIDRVAANMVAVEADAGTLHRVLAQLPERPTTPWFLSMRVQLLAAAAMVVVSFLYARPSREVRSMATLPIAEPAVVIEPRPVEVSPRQVAAPIAAARSLGPDPRSPLPAPRSDHERSLSPVEAVEAMELVGIATLSIDVESAAAIEPIVLTELALDPEGEK